MSEDSGLYGVGNGDGPYGLTTFRFLPDGTVQMDRADWNEVIQKAMRQKEEIEDLQTNIGVSYPGRWTEDQCVQIAKVLRSTGGGDFKIALEHAEGLIDEVQELRTEVYQNLTAYRKVALASNANFTAYTEVQAERDRAERSLAEARRETQYARAQEEIAHAKEGVMRAAYLPVLAQSKIAADFQETLEKIAVLCNGNLLHANDVIPLTELPALLAPLFAQLLPGTIAAHLEAYVTKRNDAQRQALGFSEGESYA